MIDIKKHRIVDKDIIDKEREYFLYYNEEKHIKKY